MFTTHDPRAVKVDCASCENSAVDGLLRLIFGPPAEGCEFIVCVSCAAAAYDVACKERAYVTVEPLVPVEPVSSRFVDVALPMDVS